MEVPPEISYREVQKTDAIDNLIRKKIAKLEQVCDYIGSVRVAIERRHKTHRTGNPYRVRIDIRVPPGHEIVVERISTKEEREEPLVTVIRRAFLAARRQLNEIVEKNRGEVKTHPEQQIMAVVDKLFPEEGYGFLRALDDRHEVYFHRNSVLHGEFDRLEIGTGVRFVEEQGEKGPQASTVEIVDKPGFRIPESSKSVLDRMYPLRG